MMVSGLPPSPCVGVCRLDEASGLCLGCGRTGDEIARWRDLDPAGRDEVWRRLPERMAGLGLAFHLLPVSGADLAERLLATARNPWSVFAIGVQGAIAEFMRFPRDRARVAGDADGLLIQSELGALRLEIPPWVKVFAFGPERGAPDEVVLAVHRSRLAASPTGTISELGPDQHAIREQDRGALLFDLGLARASIRFCVRSADEDVIASLRACVGERLGAVAERLVPQLVAWHPHRVVISRLGRIEVMQRIGQPGTPDGPHTHLMPELLASGRELRPGRDLPDGYAPAASLYPGPGTVELWCAE